MRRDSNNIVGNIHDLIAIIRKQTPEQQEIVNKQTQSLIALQRFQIQSEQPEQELSDEEIKNAIIHIFSYADEIEKIYFQMKEIRINLLEVFKS